MNNNNLRLESLTPTHTDEKVHNYFVEKIRNPDEGSDFDRLTQALRESQPEHVRIPALLSNGYRVFFLRNEQEDIPAVKAFIALQVHEDIVKIFRFEVEEAYRGQQLSVKVTHNLISLLKQDDTIRAMQIGKGPEHSENPDVDAVKLIERLENDNTGDISVNKNTHTITR